MEHEQCCCNEDVRKVGGNESGEVGQKNEPRDMTPPGSQSELDNAGKKKIKKKEEKGIDQILKSLQIQGSSEDKLKILCRKYSELQDECKSFQSTCKTIQKTLTQVSKEKEQLQSDHNKAILAKSKLEGLCRELQKQNKLVKEESLNRAKEDDDKRKEVSSKFQTTINDIQQQMNDHYQKNSALREENQELANKLKELCEKYEVREQHIDKILKTKELETQLFNAKLQQASLQLTEEKEMHLQEKQKLLQEAVDVQRKMSYLEEENVKLKAQLAVYSERFQDLQTTLSNSNDAFVSFKSEMDKMSKKMKKSEKDILLWKQKCETSNKTLLIMAEEKLLHEKETNLLQTKVGRLESLCRALQHARSNPGDGQTGVSLKDGAPTKEEAKSHEKLEGPEESAPCDAPAHVCACSEKH